MSESAHILVIDDDERLRVLLRRFLEESGFRVTDADSAAEARNYMKAMYFDLLVIDVTRSLMRSAQCSGAVTSAKRTPELFPLSSLQPSTLSSA